MKGIKQKVIELASSIALQETTHTGEDYTAVIPKALDEACIRLEIEKEEFMKMLV